MDQNDEADQKQQQPKAAAQIRPDRDFGCTAQRVELPRGRPQPVNRSRYEVDFQKRLCASDRRGWCIVERCGSHAARSTLSDIPRSPEMKRTLQSSWLGAGIDGVDTLGKTKFPKVVPPIGQAMRRVSGQVATA